MKRQSRQSDAPGAVRRILFWLGRVELVLAVLSLVAIAVLNAIGVLLRYGFNSSIVWSEEVSLLLMNVMVFLGAAVMYKARAYVVLEFFFRKFPPGLQHGLLVATWTVACTFAALTAGFGLSLYPLQVNTTSYILELPRFYATIPLIAGTASIALVSAYYAWVAVNLPMSGETTGERERATAILPAIELT